MLKGMSVTNGLLAIAGAGVLLLACGDDNVVATATTSDAGSDAASGNDGDDASMGDVGVETALVCGEPTGGDYWGLSVPLTFPIDGQPIMRGVWEDDVKTGGERREISYLIDTGAQVTCFDSDLTGDDPIPFEAELIGLETTAVCNGIVKGCDLAEAEAYIGVDIEVLLGQSTMRRLYTYIDYKNAQAWLYHEAPETEPPGMAGVVPGVMAYERQNELPVAMVGLTDEVTLPLLTDTGSGVSIITAQFFDELEAAYEGTLPRLDGYKWATNYGTDVAFITRAPRFVLGDVVVEGEWIVVIPDEHHLRSLLEESDIFIEGFLGFPHYRHFITEFQGPTGLFRFWPYEDKDHISVDEWHKVGLDVTTREGGPRVEMVFSPSDASTQGVEVGDVLLSIDGVNVSGSPADDVRRLLKGEVGESRELILRRAGEELTLEVKVDDLLPPLQ